MKARLTLTLFLAAAVLSVVLWRNLRHETAALTARRAELMSRSPSVHAGPANGSTHDPVPPDRLTTLLRQIQEEQAALDATRRRADDLAARLPGAADGEVIVSLGKIEDMGRDAGRALQSMLRATSLGADNPAKIQEAFLQWMEVIGGLPEIREFETKPEEISRFQSRALAEALSLPPAAEAAIQPLIRDAFAGMAARGLTANQRPATGSEAWIEERSHALQDLMLRLRPHVPDSGSSSARQALTFVLNLGAGMETETQMQTATQANLTFGVNWPKVPW
jgi:hypothetical protein